MWQVFSNDFHWVKGGSKAILLSLLYFGFKKCTALEGEKQ